MLKGAGCNLLRAAAPAAARCLSTEASKRYDAIVVGLGAHGSACLYHLARWGSKVLGLDRFNSISNTKASHHGQTRITRMAYKEGPEYVPLLRKSFEMYEALERETQQKLYWQTGCVNIGEPLFSAARATADDQQLPHEVLTAQQANERFPGLQLPAHMPVLYEAAGGIVEPEKMIQAHVLRAWYHGAHVKTGETVLEWEPLPDGGVAVTTDYKTYHADKLVISSGAWMEQMVPELKGLTVPGRATVGWFQPSVPELFHHSRFPVFLLQDEEQGDPFYGFPEFGRFPGVKIGKFCVSAPPCDPDNVDREMSAADTKPLEQALRRHMPKAHGDVLNFAACMFTMTPDNHFVIDTHPRHPQVVICSACSGHGFKLSPAIGYVLADMVRHDGVCKEFEQQMQIHRLSRSRPGHAAVLDRFEQPQPQQQQQQQQHAAVGS
uniref:FAD dependent oxidoreductase domain-containing protein n=1 Tax=Tetradesmus obliquus TaxID=3088 RepID=A0A383VMB1_TETOB|eukprot:jgi/Sobl393_1/9431/SZX66030.1